MAEFADGVPAVQYFPWIRPAHRSRVSMHSSATTSELSRKDVAAALVGRRSRSVLPERTFGSRVSIATARFRAPHSRTISKVRLGKTDLPPCTAGRKAE